MKTIINNIEVKVGKLIAKYDQLNAEKLDLQRNNNIKWHFIGKPLNNEKRLIEFLNTLRSTGEFKGVCRKNSTYEKGDIVKLRQLNRDKCSFIDCSGLMENHRSFWHLNKVESVLFDSIIWNKLRRQNNNRSKPGFQYNKYDYHVPTNLYDYILKVYKNDVDKYIDISKGLDIGVYNDVWVFK